MKKLMITLLILSLFVVSCGPGAGTTDSDYTADMVKFEDGRVSFLVPNDWANQSFVFKDPPKDLVRAGTEVIFYPKDREFEDLLMPLYEKDFRYTDFDLGNRTLVIYMKGVSSRFIPNGTDNQRITFYEGTVTDYKKHKVLSGETEYEACSAMISGDGLKSGAQALMYVMYGDRQSMIETTIPSFYGIAIVSKNIGSKEKELFEKMIDSFEYKTR
jgi:hypothetical protein